MKGRLSLPLRLSPRAVLWLQQWDGWTPLRRHAGLVAALAVITTFTFTRLLHESLHEHIYDFGNEALRAVQAWENHGFLSMAGMYPWSRAYFSANHYPDSLYFSKTPLHLLPLWLGYRLFGEAGFHLFKLYGSLLIVLAIGLLLASLASACFGSARAGTRQLVFAFTYGITITNEALLRYCLVDEPQYLGLFLHLLGAVLLLQWLRRPVPERWRLRLSALTFFLASWTYPILGGLTLLTVLGLDRLRLGERLHRGLRSLVLPVLLGPVLYFAQRLWVSLVFPGKLIGSKLQGRMGFTPDTDHHDGVLDALAFLGWQKSGQSMQESGVALSQVIEHYAIWVLGLGLFLVALARSRGQRQVLLLLAAAPMALFIPLFNQTLSQHPWIYGVLFAPAVVLGWVGGLLALLPNPPARCRNDLFTPAALTGVGVLIWAIQLRFFLVTYLDS